MIAFSISCWAALLGKNSLSFCLSENILISPPFLKDISAECGIWGWQIFSSVLKYISLPASGLHVFWWEISLMWQISSCCFQEYPFVLKAQDKKIVIYLSVNLRSSFMKFIELCGSIHSYFFRKSEKLWTLFLQSFFPLFSLSFPPGISHYTCVRSLNGVTQIS